MGVVNSCIRREEVEDADSVDLDPIKEKPGEIKYQKDSDHGEPETPKPEHSDSGSVQPQTTTLSRPPCSESWVKAKKSVDENVSLNILLNRANVDNVDNRQLYRKQNEDDTNTSETACGFRSMEVHPGSLDDVSQLIDEKKDTEITRSEFHSSSSTYDARAVSTSAQILGSTDNVRWEQYVPESISLPGDNETNDDSRLFTPEGEETKVKTVYGSEEVGTTPQTRPIQGQPVDNIVLVRNPTDDDSRLFTPEGGETTFKMVLGSQEAGTTPQTRPIQGQPVDDIVLVRNLIVQGPDVEMVSLYSTSVFDPYPFIVTDKGCYVTCPYCKVCFPPGAVQYPIEISMSPQYDPQLEQRGRGIFITPFVKFTSEEEMNFEEDVTISIRTSYAAADHVVSVPVQIVRIANGLQEDFTTTVLERDARTTDGHFISFRSRVFCGFLCRLEEDQFSNTQRSYYSSGFVQVGHSNKNIAILHWAIYDNMPNVVEQNRRLMEREQKVLLPECFYVRYPDQLQLRLLKQPSVGIHPEPFKQLAVGDHYGKIFDQKQNFRLTWGPADEIEHLDLEYQLLAVDVRTGVVVPLQDIKPFFILSGGDERHPVDQHNDPAGATARPVIPPPRVGNSNRGLTELPSSEPLT